MTSLFSSSYQTGYAPYEISVPVDASMLEGGDPDTKALEKAITKAAKKCSQRLSASVWTADYTFGSLTASDARDLHQQYEDLADRSVYVQYTDKGKPKAKVSKADANPFRKPFVTTHEAIVTRDPKFRVTVESVDRVPLAEQIHLEEGSSECVMS
jgi:hypothetical protein